MIATDNLFKETPLDNTPTKNRLDLPSSDEWLECRTFCDGVAFGRAKRGGGEEEICQLPSV
jgi:hypothetical protein